MHISEESIYLYMFFIVKFLNIQIILHMNLYMEVVSSLWIFMFKDLSNNILKMKFESCFFSIFNLKIQSILKLQL